MMPEKEMPEGEPATPPDIVNKTVLGPKRRGPRKKKDVVKQSDVPAAQMVGIRRASDISSHNSYTENNRIFGSKISFGSTDKRIKKLQFK